MKRYSLFRRNGVFYVEDRLEEKQRSLSTRDKAEAARLLAAYVEAGQEPGDESSDGSCLRDSERTGNRHPELE